MIIMNKFMNKYQKIYFIKNGGVIMGIVIMALVAIMVLNLK